VLVSRYVSFLLKFYCEHLQDELKDKAEHENHTLGRLKDRGSSGEPVSARLNSGVDLAGHCDYDEDLLRRFSELADKYWNGPMTLLANQQFRGEHNVSVSFYSLSILLWKIYYSSICCNTK